MNQTSKIIVAVLLIGGFLIISIVQSGSVSKTFMALLALGLYYGINGMWKKPVDEKNKEIKLHKENKPSDDLTLKK